MSTSHSSNRRRVIAGMSLIGLSVAFLADTATGLMTRPVSSSQTMIALAGFVTVLTAVLMPAAMLGLSQLLRASADRAGLLGAAFALIGWAAATRITTVIQLDTLTGSVIAGGEGVSAIGSALQSAPAVFVSIFPVGLFFPLGIILLGLALFRWHPASRWAGLLLALGGLLFPVGRAAGIGFAIVACDITLGAAFAALGWLILTRPAAWETSSS